MEVKIPKIVIKDVSELKAYENNPRNNDEAVEAVANSIREFGFKIPIDIDKDNVIIAGHTRLRAAKHLGLKEVPCILCDDLTPEQVKAFRIIDNKTAEIALWDLEKLNQELEGIKMDMEEFGFYDIPVIDEIDEYLKDHTEKPQEEKEPKRIQCPYCGEWFDIDE